MKDTIRARVTNGVLEPLERIDLPEGQEVLVTITPLASSPDFEAFHRAAGGWKGTLDAEALIRRIYSNRLITSRSEPRL